MCIEPAFSFSNCQTQSIFFVAILSFDFSLLGDLISDETTMYVHGNTMKHGRHKLAIEIWGQVHVLQL